jgi:2-methylcitrate dehydratase PrpD
MEGQGSAMLVGCGLTTSAPGAALLNSTFIHAFELDDFHPAAPLHNASLVIPALLACARDAGAVSGARWLTAAIAGFETGPRVGLALRGAEMLSRGWHSGAVFGTFSSAAAAGKLLGLSAAQFEDALGLAATQSCGLMAAQYEAMSKRMQHGFSSRNGMYAAHLAVGGYSGIKRVFERDYGGFLSTFGEGHAPDASRVADSLGRRWETMRIVVKPHAAMGGAQIPLDCMFEVMASRRFSVKEVRRIEVDVSHPVFQHGWWVLDRPITPVAAQNNLAYVLAVAAIDGAAMLSQFAPQRIDRDDIWELIPKIVARHDPEFDKGGALARGTARLRVTLTDGTILEAFRTVPAAIAQSMQTDAVTRKFHLLTEGLMADERRREIADLVLRLEDLKDLRRLVELLAPEVRGAFD